MFFSGFRFEQTVWLQTKKSEAGTMWLFELCKGFWVWHGGVGCHGKISFCFSFITYLLVFFCKIMANCFQQWIYIYLKLYIYTSTVYKTKKYHYRKIWNFDKICSKIHLLKRAYMGWLVVLPLYQYTLWVSSFWTIGAFNFFLYLQI